MVFQNNLLAGASGVTGAQAAFDSTLIGNSIWLDGSADFLNRQNGSDFSNRKEVTLSFWVQRNKFGDGTINTRQAIFAGLEGGDGFIIHFKGTDTLELHLNGTANLVTNAVFRDIGWYHILVSIDTSQALSTDRSKIYINGELITSFSSAAYPSQNSNIPGISGEMTSTENMRIGNYNNAVANFYFWNGYIAQACMIESKSIQQGDFAVSDFLDTFTFGTNGSQIIPKKDSDIAALASTAGGNSFCLDFSDSSGTDAANLGNDIANNNDFAPTSMSSANQSSNTPSLSYPLLNPLSAAFSTTLTEGNTRATGSTTNGSDLNPGIIIPKTGKWVWQITNNTDADLIYGVRNFSDMKISYDYTNLYGFYSHTGNLVQGAAPSGSYLDPASGNDVYQIYFDADTRKMWVSDNGVIPNSGDPDGGTNEAFTIPDSGFDLCPTALVGGTSPDTTFDFGMDGVSLHADGQTFKPLTSVNLPTPDFQGIDYFDVTLYEGNGFNQRVGNFVPFTDTYTIDKSVFFDDGDRRYLAKTFDSNDATATSNPGGSNSAKATISFWIKYNRSVGSGDQHIFSTANTAQTQRFMIYRNEQSAEDFFFINMNPGPKMFKAPVQSSLLSEQEWSNVVINVDLDNSTGADKVKMFVNGVQITSVDTTYQSASNSNYFLFANEDHFIGNLAPADAGYTGFCFDSYLAEMHVIDGHVKAPTDFGQVDTSTNRWVAKDYKTNVNTYGNRGFYMAFDNASGTSDGVGTDSSGNNFHFTESFVSGGSAWTSTDTVTDTPSKNFATLSSTRKSAGTLSEGNLSYDSGSASSTTLNCLATMPIPSSGKWAVKIINTTTGTNFGSVGVGYMGTTDTPVSTNVDSTTGTHGVYFSAGTTKINGVSGPTLSTWKRPADGANPFVELFFDRDANTFKSKVNGGSLETITPTLTEKQITFALVAFAGSTGSQYEVDFGQKGYTPSESGFSTLNQDNLDDTASKLTAWAWIKNRDASSDHMWIDRVRGVGKDIHSNSTNAEATNINTVQRFLQRGVQVGNDSTVNTANNSFVLWQWLLGDSATTGSTNSEGSLNTSVIAADAGHFSIVSWTMSDPAAAKTLGHGLSGAPELIIIKNRTDAGTNWPVFSKAAGNTKYQYLSTTAIAETFNMWQDTSPDADVFSVSSNNEASGSANDEMIAFCFRSVPGVCKVGEYIANNTTDNGPYVSLGFKPKWIMFKGIDIVTTWTIYDSVREPFNVGDHIFSYVNLNSADQAFAQNDIDMLADGFKIKVDINNEPNKSANNRYLYLAMADIGGGGTLPPIYGR
jgi:hypothetical protein